MRIRLLFVVVAAVWIVSVGSVQAGKNAPLQRIVFGSCVHQDKPQPIWGPMVAAQPQLCLLIGDNIYGDTQDMKVMKAKYDKLAAQPGYQKLLKACPLLATWDDHDFGVDDGGANYPKRDESQQLFLDFFNVPKDSPRRKQKGVYHAETFGPPDQRVQVIMTDTRYFRSPLKKKKVAKGIGPYVPDTSDGLTMLGEAQWQWLEKQLRQPARVRLLVSSVQVVPEDHGWEKWMNMPRERERLYKLIRDTKAAGVIVLSGDRHLAELSQMDAGIGYPLYDLTSSGLNQGNKSWRKLEKNQHRVATMNFGNNFGAIFIDWGRLDPLLRLQIRDEAGDIMIQHKIPLSLLQPGKLLAKGAGRAKLASGELLTEEVVKQHTNKKVSVLLTVRNTGSSKASKLVFLNSATDRTSDENFTVVLRPAAQEKLSKAGVADPQKHYRDQTIRVSGTLTLFQGRPQIIVTDPAQIETVKK